MTCYAALNIQIALAARSVVLGYWLHVLPAYPDELLALSILCKLLHVGVSAQGITCGFLGANENEARDCRCHGV